MAKIPRVPVENQITTLSVVKISIKFLPCKYLMIIRLKPRLIPHKGSCVFMKKRVWDYDVRTPAQKNESRRESCQESCIGSDPRLLARLLARLFGAKSLGKSLIESLAKSLRSDPMQDAQRDSLRDSCFTRALKMTRNVRKSDLKNVRMDVCMYVKTSENSYFCISGITWLIELTLGVHLKQMWPYLWYHFCWNSCMD